MRNRRWIAWILVISFGLLAVEPQPVYAGAGDWAKWAVEKVEQGLKWLWNKVPQILKEDDATIAAAMKIEGRQAIVKATSDGEKLLDLEKMMTKYEKGLHGVQDGVDMAQRHQELLENASSDLEKLVQKADKENRQDEADSGRWDGILQTLEAEQEAMRDLVTKAYAEPVPPACSFLQEEIKKSRKRLEDAYYTDYLGASEQATINAAMAHTGFQEAMGTWGEMVLSSIGLISNIVTTLTGIGEFLEFLKGSVLAVRGFLNGGLKAIGWARSKLPEYVSKMWKVVTSKEGVLNLLRKTKEMISKLFDSFTQKVQAVLKRVTDKISRAWAHLEEGELQKAWDELATLGDDVSEAQGLQAAGEQAVAQAEAAAAAAREEAQGILQKYNEAVKDKVDYLNHLHTAEETVRETNEKIQEAGGKISAYAIETAKTVDDLTLQAREMSDYFMHGYNFRREAKEAEKKYEEAEGIMKRAKEKIYRELEVLSSLLKKECLNTAP